VVSGSQKLYGYRSKIAATTASWVGSRLYRDQRYIADSQRGFRSVLSQGGVGLCFACIVLHIMFLHKHNIVGLFFGEVLFT
jgi:hypothetical protein